MSGKVENGPLMRRILVSAEGAIICLSLLVASVAFWTGDRGRYVAFAVLAAIGGVVAITREVPRLRR